MGNTSSYFYIKFIYSFIYLFFFLINVKLYRVAKKGINSSSKLE